MAFKINLKNVLIAVSVIFTLLTITSAGLAILTGNYTDGDLHLLMRFLVTTIAIGGMLVFKLSSELSSLIVHSLHYGITVGSIFLLVWVSGFFIRLHPEAYRDIFLNYTVIYIVISLIFVFSQKYRVKKS